MAAVCAVIIATYYIIDPMTSRLAPKCLIHTLTNLDCPGCGSQRMLHALLHGDLASAWTANPFLLCLLPLLIAWIWIDADPSTYPRAARILNSPAFIIAIFIIVILWTILRNIPGLITL